MNLFIRIELLGWQWMAAATIFYMLLHNYNLRIISFFTTSNVNGMHRILLMCR